MIYLGDQISALTAYSKEAVCWLSVKLKGRLTERNKSGYSCKDPLCEFCSGNGNKRGGIDQDFRDLFSTVIIESLIKSKPNDLLILIDDLKTRYNKTDALFDENCKKLILDSGYTNWFLKENKNYWLSTLLDQHTCTYCNREYIFTYKNISGGKGMVPQFDHWFAKADYPLLSLSFYNLIPSCSTCNTIKSVKKLNLIDHLHPYVNSNISNSYEFSYLPITNIDNRIVFKNNSLLSNKGIDTVNALNLPLIYKGHSSKELQDLIDLRYKYSDNYLNILLENTFGDLHVSKEERYRLIFGVELEEKNYHKRIFSKFKIDIMTQLLNIQ